MSDVSDDNAGSACASCPSNPQNAEKPSRTNGGAPTVVSEKYRKNYGAIDWSKKMTPNWKKPKTTGAGERTVN